MKAILLALCMAMLIPVFGSCGMQEGGSEVFPVLDDRLTIKMLRETADSPMQFSIAAAPSSDREETRLIFDKDEEQLTVYAYEIFKYSSGNIEDDAKLLADEWLDLYGAEYALSKKRRFGGAEAVVFSPVEFDASGEAVLIKCALVKMPDNTLINVCVFANQDMLADKRHCIGFADDILKTLRPGGRSIDISTHKESIWPYEIEVSEGYVYVPSTGVDFAVYYITKIVPFDVAAQPRFGIYMGFDPSGADEPEGDGAGGIPDSVLGHDIKWGRNEEEGAIRMETVFGIPEAQSGLMMHVFITAYDEAELEEMKNMVYSLQRAN